MRAVGIIAEYNPFHLGHAAHLAQARERAGADAVVVVLSGCFTQRGEAVLLSPRARAEMALRAGADAVLLLLACWAVRDAEHFALGGVSLLQRMGVEAVSFGVERDCLPLLEACAALLEAPDDALRDALHARLSAGLPYPAALAAACEARLPGAQALLSEPNNTLAVCYLRAIRRLNADIAVIPVQRSGAYHATALDASSPSAGALRGAILRGAWGDVRRAMPPEAFAILTREALAGRVHRPEALDQALTLCLRSMDADAWRALPDLSEGIGDRLRAAAARHATRADILAAAKTRRYPAARLSRLCAHALLGMTQATLDASALPPAALPLGLTETGRALLSQARKNGLPVLGKAADFDLSAPWLQVERRAYDLWALGCGLPAGLIFTQGIARLPR